MSEPVKTGTWVGSVSARITRVNGIDTVEEIDFVDGQFTRRIRVVSGPTPPLLVVLNLAARQELLQELRAELAAPPVAGTDVGALRVFAELLEDSIQADPTARFSTARFGSVTHDETLGVYYGHLGLGVDVAGTVRDDRGVLSFEQHVITMAGGRFEALGPGDAASLAAALTAALDGGSAPAEWRPVRDDADKSAQKV